MKPVKKSLLVVASICCLITAGVTYALLSKVTETATNTFSSDRSISLKLREDKWVGFDFNESYPDGAIPGTVIDDKETNKEILGFNIAKNYHPGDAIPKNPIVMNTSDENEYVAIKVVYENSQGVPISKTEFENLYGKFQHLNSSYQNGMNNEFELVDTDEEFDLYIYKKVLNSNTTTPALFDRFVIKLDIEPDGNKLPSFNIKVKAYAVQETNVTIDKAKESLLNLAKKN